MLLQNLLYVESVQIWDFSYSEFSSISLNNGKKRSKKNSISDSVETGGKKEKEKLQIYNRLYPRFSWQKLYYMKN